MQITKHTDLRDGSSCELSFVEEEGWLQATWIGYVDPTEAYNGASRYLQALQKLHCPYLLNDNSRLSGPWFDSVEWLQAVWGPRAAEMGLRYVAHVNQPHDLLEHATGPSFDFGHSIILQVFDGLELAREWLREMQGRSQAQAPTETGEGLAG